MRAWLTANWPAPANIHALTTLRYGLGHSSAPFDCFNLGLRNGDEPATALANRNTLRQALSLPAQPHWLQQVHGTTALDCDNIAAAEHADAEPCADAASTRAPATVLAVLSADCLPVLLCSTDGMEIAAVHAGWRGLAAGILERTVAQLRSAPAHLLAWLGPAASVRAYEVGAEVYQAFVAHNPCADAAFIATRPGHWRVDLYALARQRLHAAGLHAAAIFGGDYCTISQADLFFSHRRDSARLGSTGRMATLIWRD